MTDLYDFLNTLSAAGVMKALPNRRIKEYPGGAASPYKAILLLLVFQKIKNGAPEFAEGIIRYVNCVEGFDQLYREIFGIKSVERVHEKLAQPFWNLGTGKPQIWNLVPNNDATDELFERVSERKQVKSVTILNRLVDYAKMSPGDVELLQDEVANDAIRGFFITTHFQNQGSEAFDALKRI